MESAEGLLAYQNGVNQKPLSWWNNLSDEDRYLAQVEFRHYESLIEEERDPLWNEVAESIGMEAESEEIDLPAK